MATGTSAVFGSASWLDPSRLEALGFRGGQGPLLGHVRWYKRDIVEGIEFYGPDWLHYPGDGHLCTVAKTGAGKFRRVIKPNLLTYPGSAIVIDPKGETTEQTARYRAETLDQKVFVFDPYHEVPDAALPSGRHSFNPVDFVRSAHRNPFDAAQSVAESFITPSAKDPRWQIAAQLLLAAHLLYVALDPLLDEAPELRTFESAWRNATAPELKDLALAQMETSTIPFVAAQAKAMRERKTDETSSIEKEFFIQCARIAASPQIQAAMQSSDLDFGRLREESITVYVVLPFDVIETQGGFFRRFLSCALGQIMARGIERHRPDGAKRPPVYFMMDEFLAQGRTDRILKAFREMRGYNVKLHVFLQDLGAARDVYGDAWSTIVGNCGALQYFGGTGDLLTQDYFSKLTGQTTRRNVSESTSRNEGSSWGEGFGSNSSYGSNSGSSASPGGGSVSSGSNNSSGTNVSTNKGGSQGTSSSRSESVVAGTLMTPEQVGNLQMPAELLVFPGIGCIQAYIPDSLTDFIIERTPENAKVMRQKSVARRPCRSAGCPGQIDVPVYVLNGGAPRQLFFCPICNGRTDTFLEGLLYEAEQGRLAAADIPYRVIAAASRSGDTARDKEFEQLRTGAKTKYCFGEPYWRPFFDPFAVSGRYPQIFGRLGVEYKDRHTAWNLYDESHPDRPLIQNPYIEPEQREVWGKFGVTERLRRDDEAQTRARVEAERRAVLARENRHKTQTLIGAGLLVFGVVLLASRQLLLAALALVAGAILLATRKTPPGSGNTRTSQLEQRNRPSALRDL